MAATLATMDFSQELKTFWSQDTFHQYANRGHFSVEVATYHNVGSTMSRDVFPLVLVFWNSLMK
jgi:hypothetical protein